MRDLPWEELNSIQSPHLSRYPNLVASADEVAERNKLTANQQRFLERCVDGGTSLRDIYRISSLPRRETAAVVMALHQAGQIQFEPVGTAGRQDRELADAVQLRHAKIVTADYFAFLEEKAAFKVRQKLVAKFGKSLGNN